MPSSRWAVRATGLALLSLSLAYVAKAQKKNIDPVLLAKARGGDVDAAKRLITLYANSGNQKESCKWIFIAGQDGDMFTEVYIGYMYRGGSPLCGVAKDDTQAAAWYRKAADQGDAIAQDQMAFFYENGQGVTQSHVQSAIWWHKAAEQDAPDAQYYLGLAYYNGQGVAKNFSEAVRWFRKAAELRQGD